MDWDGSAWTASKSNTCFNQCKGYVFGTWTTCTVSSCSNPPADGAYCGSQKDCKTYASGTTSWSGTSSGTCLNQCMDYSVGTWSTCTVANCGPSSAGQYCASQTSCKTINAGTGLFESSFTSTCANTCFDYVALGTLPSCVSGNCANPTASGSFCVSTTKCMAWDGSAWTASKSNTCFNQCHGYVFGTWTSCTVSSCSNPPAVGVYCGSQKDCKTYASGTTSWSGTSSGTCLNQCMDYSVGTWSTCSVDTCGPSSSGSYCSSSTDCKTLSSITGLWDEAFIS